MTGGFGAAVHGEVLGAGRGLQPYGVAALQPADERLAQQSGQVGILAVSLLPAAPAGIAEDVDVGSPEREALVVHAALARAVGLVVDGPGFGRGDFTGPFQRRGIEGRGHAYCLREHGHAVLRATHAVQALVPPVVGRNSEPLDGRRDILHLGCLLFERQARNKVLYALFDGQPGVAERILLRLRCRDRRAKEESAERHPKDLFHGKECLLLSGSKIGASGLRQKRTRENRGFRGFRRAVRTYFVITVLVRDMVPSHRISTGSSASVLSI